MAREQFISRNFKPDTLEIIAKADEIIGEYQAQGFALTLRQLYYQFVARALIPNKQSEYKRLGSIVNDARLAGLLDWDAIEDRTRNVATHSSWESPENIIHSCALAYRENLWGNQKFSPEIWIEKDALMGVVEPVAVRWRVPYFACRGYTSQSETYAAGKRFASARRQGKTPIVFHLGDHDPSGLDMTRDNADRLRMFARHNVEVQRLALNWDQIEQYNPPPNPAKDTDARFAGYALAHGNESWELDALEPTVIDALIERALTKIVDRKRWKAGLADEQQNVTILQAVGQRWAEVERFIRNDGGAS